MIALPNGLEVGTLPVALEHVREILEYDGPLLSEFKNASGEPYLYYWCDCDSESNRWLVLRSSRTSIARYEAGLLPLRSLIQECSDGTVYVCDIDSEGHFRRVRITLTKELPEDYFPAEDSFARDASPSDTQNVVINGSWGFEQLAHFPRKYMQAYAFLAFFGARGEPQRLETLDYDLKGGWVFHTLYEKMRSLLGSARADIEAIAYASPGYMRFSADANIAADVRDTLMRFMPHATEIRPDTAALTEWSNDKGDLTPQTARAAMDRVGKRLGVNTEALLARVNDPKQAAKILASFVRRLIDLAEYHLAEQAIIAGVHNPVTAETAADEGPVESVHST